MRSPLSNDIDVAKLAARLRLNATQMVAIQGFGYLGQALGSADVLAVLFGRGVLRPGWDRFILSPGHYAIALYGVAAEMGLIPREALADYGKDGALLEAISTERTPFVDLTCGSLGQGLSGAIGFALAASYAGEDRRVFAFLSDGEMEEGQVWEAATFAAHHRLENLIVMIDANDSQVDGAVSWVTTIEPLADKWRAFGWHVQDIDGHDLSAIEGAFCGVAAAGLPTVIIARTDILGRLQSIPSTVDGHFVKLDAALQADILQELRTACR